MQLRTYQVFGGVSINPQITALRAGCDILVATPGRLLDLAQQRMVDLSKVQILVLDEADRMLDMGFINDIRKIIKLLPQKRQNLMFSATYSDDIRGLAERLLHDPLSIQVAPRNAPIELVEQRAYRVPKEQKRHLAGASHPGRPMAPGLDFHAHQAWRQSADATAGGRRHSGRGHPRQQKPGSAREGARHVQARPGHGLGGHRSRGPRSRHQGTAAGGQLRTAQRAGRLRASHRPHRPCGRRGRSHLVGLERRIRIVARHRTRAPPQHPDAAHARIQNRRVGAAGRARRPRLRRASPARRASTASSTRQGRDSRRAPAAGSGTRSFGRQQRGRFR